MSNWAKYLPNNDGTKGGYHHPKTGAAAAGGGTPSGNLGSKSAEGMGAMVGGGDSDSVSGDVVAKSPKAGGGPPNQLPQR